MFNPPTGFRLAMILMLFTASPASLRAQTITSFTPQFGAPGTQVTLNGSGFSSVTRIQFGNAAADFAINSSVKITATVPALGESGRITAFGSLTKQSATDFTVAPRVDSFSPIFASVNQQITINGGNFISGQTTVRFGGIAAAVVSVTAPTMLFATVPASAVSGPINVSTFAGTNTTSSNLVVSGTAVITGFNPPNGNFGDPIVISGGDFTGATAVRFNGSNASFAVTSSSQISANVPTNATTGTIQVVTPSGTATSFSNFVATGGAPLIISFSPVTGTAGEPVVITGAGFLSVTNVTFNGSNAMFGATADTQITAIVPPNVSSGPIVLTSPFGSATSTNPFIVTPLINSFDPVSGAVGAVVTINGQNLLGVTNVNFNGTNAAFAITAGNQIQAQVPFGATTGPMQVIGPSGTNTTSSNFTVTVGIPLINSFTPTNGLATDQIQISGSHLGTVTNVSFNGATAVFGAASDTQITATVPAGATTGPITVFSPTGTNVSTDLFYLPPRLTSFTPSAGSVGSVVTFTGTNFTGAVRVDFSGSNSAVVPAVFTNISANRIDAVVPTNTVAGPVTIVTPGGPIISTNNFVILPRVDSFVPPLAPAGTSIQVFGLNFESVTSVKFNNINAPVFTVNSPTQLTVTIPFGGLSGPVSVGTAAGAGISTQPFLITSSTDISHTQTYQPTIALVGTSVNILISMTNKGPSVATGVKLTTTIPAGLTFSSATSTLGTCAITGRVVTCQLGVMTNGTAAIITITASAFAEGLWENRIDLALNEADLNANDNSSVILIPIVSEASRTISIQPLLSTSQIGFSWPVSAINFVLQANTNLASTNGWVDLGLPVIRVTNQPFVFNTVTDAIVLPNKFYRLRSP